MSHLRPSRARTATVTQVRTGDRVSMRERLRVTQYLRITAVALVLSCAVLAPQALSSGGRKAVVVTAAYVAVVLLGEALARRMHERIAVLFCALLLIDGVWLAWASYLTGSLSSPIRYLVLLHLGAVALLATYRTCLTLAVWHSLLLLAIHRGQQPGGGLRSTEPAALGSLIGSAQTRLVVFVVVLWLVALSTAALSAVNERELRRRRHELEALTDLAEALERTADSASVARTLLDSVVDTFGFPRGVVLAGPEGRLPLLASYGLDEATARRPGRPAGSTIVARAHGGHAPVLVSGLDEAADPWLCRLMPGARDLVVVPLQAEGRPLGAMVLEQSPEHGSQLSRRVASGLERSASYAALALRNAWLLEQVQRLAATDGLTKIANRRTFESTLEREVARATRSAEHLSLVMIDIDHFKQLNDQHGHQAGDEVLRNVAAALSCECRDFDTPARYGGEEFAVVLPGCGPEEAHLIAERLRRAVAAAPSSVPITASAGVATYPAHAGDADTLVRAADDALYESKRGGRDRTTVSAGVPPEAQVDALLRRAVTQRLGRHRTEGPHGSLPDATAAQPQTGGG